MLYGIKQGATDRIFSMKTSFVSCLTKANDLSQIIDSSPLFTHYFLYLPARIIYLQNNLFPELTPGSFLLKMHSVVNYTDFNKLRKLPMNQRQTMQKGPMLLKISRKRQQQLLMQAEPTHIIKLTLISFSTRQD